MFRKRLDWQPFAYSAAQRIDAFDLGAKQWIGCNLFTNSQRVYRIEFAVKIGVGKQCPLISCISG